MLMNLLEIDVPVISAVNGPALIHSELAALANVVLAADTAAFRDTHMGIGVVPGDGCHSLRYSRLLFVQPAKEAFQRDLVLGLALQGQSLSALGTSPLKSKS